jgi:hypothetical protein
MWDPHVIHSSPLMNSAMSKRRWRAVLGGAGRGLEGRRGCGGAAGGEAAASPVKDQWGRRWGVGGGLLLKRTRNSQERASLAEESRGPWRRRVSGGGGPLDPGRRAGDCGGEGRRRAPCRWTTSISLQDQARGGEKYLGSHLWPNRNG